LKTTIQSILTFVHLYLNYGQLINIESDIGKHIDENFYKLQINVQYTISALTVLRGF